MQQVNPPIQKFGTSQSPSTKNMTVMLGPEGLESIIDNLVPSEFESVEPETTMTPEEDAYRKNRKSFKDALSRRDTELPIMHAKTVSEVLDTTDISQDRKDELTLGGGYNEVNLQGLVLESRKQVMTSSIAMNFPVSNWRKQSIRHMESFGDLTAE